MSEIMRAEQLAERFTLEQLREAYDYLDVATIALHGGEPVRICVASVSVLTTPHELGEAKLVSRGWIGRARRPHRTR